MITLRRVCDTDVFPFYRWWSHVETTRHNPRPKQDLTWHEHVQWFIKNFDNPYWLVAEHDGQAVGAMRRDDDGYVSIVVAPERRGRGFGQELIREASSRYPKPAYAKIHRLNRPSVEAFTHAGYRLDAQRSEEVWLVYVLE